jgi:hypothetical protein
MKRTKPLSLLSAFALIAATPLLAQEGEDFTGAENTPADVLRLPTFVKASLGSNAAVYNDDEERLGIVRNHVIDRRSGRVLFVGVTATQGDSSRQRLVPYARFTWDVDSERLLLSMTADELTALPEVDATHLEFTGRVGLTGAEGDFAQDEEDSSEPLAAAFPREQPNLDSAHILGSEIVAEVDTFASVSDLILEPSQGTIAFVLARGHLADGNLYVIPWGALTWKAGETAEQQGRFTLESGGQDLSNAPTLRGGDPKDLAQREIRESIYEFYDLTPPLVDRTVPGIDRG